MLELTIGDVERGQFAYNRFCIYLVRDEEQALYVGKSERNVIRRLTEHWGNPDEDGYLHRLPSLLGQHVLSQWPKLGRFPGSHAWQVELYTLADCVSTIHWYDDCILDADVDTAEQAMISLQLRRQLPAPRS